MVYIDQGFRFLKNAIKNKGKYFNESKNNFEVCLGLEAASFCLIAIYIFLLIVFTDCCEELNDCFTCLYKCMKNCCPKTKKKHNKEKIKSPNNLTVVPTESEITINDSFFPSILPNDSRGKEKKIIKDYTNISKNDIENISKDIINTQIYNPSLQKERIKSIKEISKRIYNNNLDLEDYIKNVSQIGSYIKHSIIYDIFNNKNNFYSNEELAICDEKSNLFVENALSCFLSKGNVICAIEKTTSNEEEAMAIHKLITNGFIFQKICHCFYNFGQEQNNKIFSDKEKRNKFIDEKKAYYSKVFNCQKNDIIITNFKLEPLNITFDVIKIGGILSLNNIKDHGLEKYTYKALVEACRISPSLFDHNYDNKDGGWGKGQKRGPPHHLMDYDPPLGFLGLGLNVLNKYDGGDNTWLGMNNVEGEWYIAYHGTKIEFVKDIINKGLGAGERQAYQSDDNINELSKSQFIKCGRGVYCTPKIREAESYSTIFSVKNSNYKMVFMCRVNPYKIRIAKGNPNYWIISGDSLAKGNIKKYDDEIRIYRLLFKKQ